MTCRITAPVVPALLVGAVLAQPLRPSLERVPPEVVLETIRAAYSKRPTADEVLVHAKGPRGIERTESLVVRIDPGATPGSDPDRVLIELGALRVCITGSDLVAINAQSPGRYFQARLSGPPTPKALASVLPPIPAPQLALACADAELRSDLTTYTPRVTWAGASIDSSARPALATLTGSSTAGPVSLTALAGSGRLSKLSATLGGREGETTLELSIRPVDPGDPASWAISTERRERVRTLAELKGVPAAGPAAPTGGRGLTEPPQPTPPANERPPG